MMARIEKTVFISYHRKHFSHAQAFSSTHYPPDDEPPGYSYKISEAD
jgi:hypothetical protein